MKSPKTYLVVVLALTTIGGAVLAWRQYQDLAELRAVALDKNERADLQKKIWDLQKQIRELNDQLVARQPVPSAEDMLTAATDEPPAGDQPGRGSRGGARGGRAGLVPAQGPVGELMTRPEVQAILESQRKLGVEQRYAALFHNLNLTPDQADKLATILADRPATLRDVRTAARDQGIDPRTDRDGFAKLMTAAQNDIDNSIRAVIGDAGVQQLQNYEQTIPQRNVVNDLQQRLSYSDSPLTPGQAEQLVQILAANSNSPARPASQNTNDPGAAVGVGPLGGRGDLGVLAGAFVGGAAGGALGNAFAGGNTVARVTPAAVAQAQTVLTAPQVAALQQIQQQQQQTQQLRQLVNQALRTPPSPDANGGNAGGGRRGGG
ncbi:MAG TPA: hypothetical protein VHD62_06945 [Opitutaceae bacterium]|nr:hypothetical protein [Opitutaceae bacterium]